MVGETSREWFDLLLGPGGLLVALLLVILTGVRKLWVFGWYASTLEKDRDYWKEMAVRSLGAAEKATAVAQTTSERKSADEMSDAEVADLARKRGVM